jgi:hypothetical protein
MNARFRVGGGGRRGKPVTPASALLMLVAGSLSASLKCRATGPIDEKASDCRNRASIMSAERASLKPR